MLKARKDVNGCPVLISTTDKEYSAVKIFEKIDPVKRARLIEILDKYVDKIVYRVSQKYVS